jgi:O-antigen ligase
VLSAYVIVDILSNRSPFEVFISYLTFNTASAYNRVLIWQFGTAEIFRHPFFGIGMNEWTNPWWMSQSMDNFWLYTAVRHGLPALLLLAAAILSIFAALAGLKRLDPVIHRYRLGWMISLCGLVVAGATVHYWHNMFCIFMFILGSGVWMLDHRPRSTAAAVQRTPRATPPRPALVRRRRG